MEPNLFRYVWQHSRADQIWILFIVLAALPFYFVSLDIPKTIVNGPIQGQGFEEPGATAPFLKWEVGVPGWLGGEAGETVTFFPGFEMGQTSYLIALCMAFLFFVCINGGFKFYINTYKGRLGERMLRRLRYQLVDRVLRFPLPYFKRVKASEVATMVKDEVEPLGGFIGDAFAQPLYQTGLAGTALFFILVQSFWLGLVAAGIVGVQAILIPKLRKRLLELGRERQLAARALAGRLGELVDGAAEVHVHDTSNYERAEITARLGRIFNIRYKIFYRKFFVKFLNNFLSQMTPFLFYLVGGYLAIRGSLDVGQLVAVIAAYKDLPGPIKELIDWDQQRLDVQIKYEQVIEQFQPSNMTEPGIQDPETVGGVLLASPLAASGISFVDDTGAAVLENLSISVDLDDHVAVVGDGSSGKEVLGAALARLLPVSAGRIKIGEADLETMPEATTGRRLSYVGQDVQLQAGSVRDNLLYALKHRPLVDAVYDTDEERAHRTALEETILAGNSEFDPRADWVDYQAAGANGPDDIDDRLSEVLRHTELYNDVYEFGIRGRVDPQNAPDLVVQLVTARKTLRDRLKSSGLEHLVVLFDPDRYNRNATIGENILFGTAVGPTFEARGLACNDHLLHVLTEAELLEPLYDTGRMIAETMVELFSDLPPDHPFFEEASLISADELPDYQTILARVAKQPFAAIEAEDREKLTALSFAYIEPRHRMGLLDDHREARLLEARRLFAETLPDQYVDAIEFIDPTRYMAESSIQDNILMGRVTYGEAQATERVGEQIKAVLEELDLKPAVFRVGLDYDVGSGGKRLTNIQRQKLGLARALLKRPDMLIINAALAVLDKATQARIVENVLEARRDGEGPGGLLWMLATPEFAERFNRVLVMENGRIVEDGPAEEVNGRVAALAS